MRKNICTEGIINYKLSSFFCFIDITEPGIQCCSPDYAHRLAPEITNPACAPIDVPRSDPFYGPLNMQCLNFIRTDTIAPINCQVGAAQKVCANFKNKMNIFTIKKKQKYFFLSKNSLIFFKKVNILIAKLLC